MGSKPESSNQFELQEMLEPSTRSPSPRISFRKGEVKNGLLKLVLTLVEFLRELLERQAIRRMESGSLSEAQVERLGSTFLELSQEMQKLREEFGLAGEELNLDLGPLGKLL